MHRLHDGAFDFNSTGDHNISELPWKNGSFHSTQDWTPRDITSRLDKFFSRLHMILRITESGMMIDKGGFQSSLSSLRSGSSASTASEEYASSMEEANELVALGTRLTELFLHFHAITDMLVLHTMRQSPFGHEIMTPARTGLPVARLALLLYTMVFRHPIFECYAQHTVPGGLKDNGEVMMLPTPLLPFCKLPIYYSNYFFEASTDNILLSNVRDFVVRLVGGSSSTST